MATRTCPCSTPTCGCRRSSGASSTAKRGVRRLDYLLSLEELERIADAQVHPSHRTPKS